MARGYFQKCENIAELKKGTEVFLLNRICTITAEPYVDTQTGIVYIDAYLPDENRTVEMPVCTATIRYIKGE